MSGLAGSVGRVNPRASGRRPVVALGVEGRDAGQGKEPLHFSPTIKSDEDYQAQGRREDAQGFPSRHPISLTSVVFGWPPGPMPPVMPCRARPRGIATSSPLFPASRRWSRKGSIRLLRGCRGSPGTPAARPASGARIIYETRFSRAPDRDWDTKKPAGRPGRGSMWAHSPIVAKNYSRSCKVCKGKNSLNTILFLNRRNHGAVAPSSTHDQTCRSPQIGLKSPAARGRRPAAPSWSKGS